ncbi:MAG: hypothetical protein K5696_00170 [Lachnospiraceae bacterium]|nr:hypothetical protein [Lachnospiraceae bacterium]
MGVSAVVDKGQVTNMESAVSKEQKSSATNVDKDQFMTLLVAQMKYQDPLEPTSNTEYISQYATFSELEQMQNMSKSLELSRASELVGKVVVIQPSENNMLTQELEGQVDKVTYINNKAYVEIGGRTFAASDVSQVMSDEYSQAKRVIEAWGDEIDKLPNVNEITLADHANTIYSLYNVYDAFSDETKALVDPSYVTAINQYKNRIDELAAVEAENARNAAEAAEAENAEDQEASTEE